MITSYVGTHPEGRRYYAKSTTGTPLVFAVFFRSARSTGGKWQRVALIEDRPYPNELHRTAGGYVPLGRDMRPCEKADAVATWHRDISANGETRVVELKPAAGRS